jgi:hypothetical protein
MPERSEGSDDSLASRMPERSEGSDDNWVKRRNSIAGAAAFAPAVAPKTSSYAGILRMA